MHFGKKNERFTTPPRLFKKMNKENVSPAPLLISMSPATSIMGSSRKQQSVLRFRPPNRGKTISPNSAKQILLKELGEVCMRV